MRLGSSGKLSMLVAGALAIGAILPGVPAAASNYTVDDLETYLMDFENASGTADAKEYLTHGGKTYFTALSLQYGRAIWALDHTTNTTTKVVDNWTGSITGYPHRLFAHGDYLFFWDQNTTQFSGGIPYVLKISTGQVTPISVSGVSTIFSSNSSSFAVSADMVYFLASETQGGALSLFRFDTTTGTAVNLGATGFDHRTNMATSTANGVRSGVLSLMEHNGFLFAVQDLAYPTHDGLVVYDIANDTWNTSIAGDSWPLLVGEYSVGGQDLAFVMIPSSTTQWSGSNFKLNTISTGGVLTQFSSENAQYSSSLKLFQYGSRLLALHSPGSSTNLVEINSDGTFTDLTAIVSGGGTFNATSAQVVGTQIFLTGFINSSSTEQMFLWSGSNSDAMTLIPDVTSRGDTTSYISSYGYIGSWGANTETGATPTGIIRSMYKETSIGFEPYHIGLDGSVTLLRDFNLGSEGSSPDLDCSIVQDGTLFSSVQVISRAAGSASSEDAFAVVTPTSTNLEYSVDYLDADINGTEYRLQNYCGFASDGTNVYFTAYANSADGLFKRSPDGTVTYLSALGDDSERSVYHDNKIYMALDEDHNNNLWVFDLTTNTATQLTGQAGGVYADDSVDADYLVSIGKYLFFNAEVDASGDEFVFMQDMTQAFSPVNLTTRIAIDPNHLGPQDLMVHDGKLYFEEDPDNDDIRSIYEYDPATDTLTNYYTPSFAGATSVFYNYFLSSDAGLFALTYVNVGGTQVKKLIAISDSGGTEVTLPAGITLDYAAAIPGGIMISSDTGVPYTYDGSTFELQDLSFASRTWALRDAIETEHGTFFAYSEYPYDESGLWDTELGYMGVLQPIAVERFGQPVDEDPAQPYTTDPDVLEGRANGTIEPQIITPPSGGGSSGGSTYQGPVLKGFSSKTLDPCTAKAITITGTNLAGVKASIQGKSVTVVESTDSKLVLAFPAGLTPATQVDLEITSTFGRLTFQDLFQIPEAVCSQNLSKGRWTQLQSDGKTVKMYAKDPIADGKIQFFVDGEEIAWVNAVDESDPKLSFASSYPYLVRSVELHPGKNRFEIKLDGVRVWRATYVPKG